MKTLILTFASLALPGTCYAAANPALTAYFDRRFTTVEQAATLLKDTNEAAALPAMTLTDVNVDISPTATFGLSDVASLSISPEVDLILTP